MWVSRKRKMMWISLVRKSREEPTQKWVGTGGAAAGIQNWHRPCFAFIAAHADVVISTLFFLSLFSLFPFFWRSLIFFWSQAMVISFHSLQFGIWNLEFSSSLSLFLFKWDLLYLGLICICISLFFLLYKPLSSTLFSIFHFHKTPFSLSASSFIFALFQYFQSRYVSLLPWFYSFSVLVSVFLFITYFSSSFPFTFACGIQFLFVVSYFDYDHFAGFLFFIGYLFPNRIWSSFYLFVCSSLFQFLHEHFPCVFIWIDCWLCFILWFLYWTWYLESCVFWGKYPWNWAWCDW